MSLNLCSIEINFILDSNSSITNSIKIKLFNFDFLFHHLLLIIILNFYKKIEIYTTLMYIQLTNFFIIIFFW